MSKERTEEHVSEIFETNIHNTEKRRYNEEEEGGEGRYNQHTQAIITLWNREARRRRKGEGLVRSMKMMR
jgi:hypothetical protein